MGLPACHSELPHVLCGHHEPGYSFRPCSLIKTHFPDRRPREFGARLKRCRQFRGAEEPGTMMRPGREID